MVVLSPHCLRITPWLLARSKKKLLPCPTDECSPGYPSHNSTKEITTVLQPLTLRRAAKTPTSTMLHNLHVTPGDIICCSCHRRHRHLRAPLEHKTTTTIPELLTTSPPALMAGGRYQQPGGQTSPSIAENELRGKKRARTENSHSFVCR